jgi:hypothetical protein
MCPLYSNEWDVSEVDLDRSSLRTGSRRSRFTRHSSVENLSNLDSGSNWHVESRWRKSIELASKQTSGSKGNPGISLSERRKVDHRGLYVGLIRLHVLHHTVKEKLAISPRSTAPPRLRVERRQPWKIRTSDFVVYDGKHLLLQSAQVDMGPPFAVTSRNGRSKGR